MIHRRIIKTIYDLLCKFSPALVPHLMFFYFVFLETFSKNPKIITGKRASYFADGFATLHHVPFLEDSKFISAYTKSYFKNPEYIAGKPDELSIAWRAHICVWAANQALSLEGDFVECGVWYGMLSRTMCEYVDFNKIKRSFYLFDTWGKMPGSHPNPNYQHDIFTSVKDRFSKFKNVHLIRGAVPNSFDQVQIKKIAYLGIDMNDGIAELATLEKFYDKVVSGGIIYFDDYGPFLKVRKVVDDFFKDKPESLLYFPSGNAIIIKI